MKKIFYILLAFHFSLLTIYAQPSITWQRLYNGLQSQDDDGAAICQGDNGNVYIAGYTTLSSGSRRVYVIKINPYGDTIWTKIVNINSGNGGGWALSLLAAEDGGCLVSGDASVKFLIRLNIDGNVVWQYIYSSDSQYYDIKKASNGNYICAGISSQGGTVLRVDSSGNLKWDKIYPNYFLHDIQVTDDNGCLVAGYTVPNTAIIIKLDSNGSLNWSNFYRINNQPTLANSFKKDEINGNYILSGNYWNGSNDVAYFVKFNYSMIPLDTHVFVPLRTGELLHSMEVLRSNKYVWTLYFQTQFGNDSSFNRFLITDVMGNIIYQRTKYTKNYEELVRIHPVNNGDIIFLGDAEYSYNPTLQDIYAIRTDSLLNFPTNIIGILNNQNSQIFKNTLNCYPNPSNNSTVINYIIEESTNTKLVLYDLIGREVKILVDKYCTKGNYRYTLNTTDLASGIYVLELNTKGVNISIKISIIK